MKKIFSIFAVLAIIISNPAMALDINQFNLTRNAPYLEVPDWTQYDFVVNDRPEYLLQGQDITGIGFRYDDITMAAVLITPKHVLMNADSANMGDFGSLAFVTSSGDVVQMNKQEVVGVIAVQGTIAPHPPLLVIELTEEVPDSITPVEIDEVRLRADMIGQDVILYGPRFHGDNYDGSAYILPVVAPNKINADFNPDDGRDYLAFEYNSSGPNTPDGAGWREDQDLGDPSLLYNPGNGRYELIGLGTGIAGDTYVPLYRNQIESILQTRGYSLDPDQSFCLADLNQDNLMDLDDVDLFIAAFVAQEPVADLALPHGLYDLADVNTFIQLFRSCAADLND